VPDESQESRRAGGDPPAQRPIMLAIAGDSAAGRTTLTRGLVEALGPERCMSLCTDDYHRCLGRIGDTRSEPLAITQLLLMFHLVEAAR
jgi:hypothetical protein